MHRSLALAYLASVLALAGAGTTAAEPVARQGRGPVSIQEVEAGQGPCVSEEFNTRLANQARGQGWAPALPAFEGDSTLAWPLPNALHDGIILVNYVDDDPYCCTVRDYMGGEHTYDGHTGTDLMLYNFRAMDRGVPVLAAAGGFVSDVADGYFDRNTTINALNLVRVTDPHGTSSYFHLRRNSTAVRLGETVQQGQMLGLVGSSGTPIAHLHFETYYEGRVRDPWSGPFNLIPSLWIDQEGYVGTAPLRIYDMGITTDAAYAPDPRVKYSQPIVFGSGEATLRVWVQLQGQGNDSYDLEIRRPDGSLFGGLSKILSEKIRLGWHIMSWTIAPPIQPEEFGPWTVNALIGGSVVKSLEFQVGETTIFVPRFWPLAGRSFHLNDSTTYSDTLRVSSLGGPVTYSLKDAPLYVSLDEDSIVTIHPPTSHWSRNRFFQAIANDGMGLQDTMWYHLVDYAGSLVVGVQSDGAADAEPRLSAAIAPNPLRRDAVLTVHTAREGPLKVTLFAVSGRMVREVVNEPRAPSGVRTIPIETRGADGRELGSGVYFYRVQTAEGVVARRFVLLR